jgi:hypothetical protein
MSGPIYHSQLILCVDYCDNLLQPLVSIRQYDYMMLSASVLLLYTTHSHEQNLTTSSLANERRPSSRVYLLVWSPDILASQTCGHIFSLVDFEIRYVIVPEGTLVKRRLFHRMGSTRWLWYRR